MRRRQRRMALVAAIVVGLAILATSGGWDVLQIYTGVGLPVRSSSTAMELVAHRGDLDRFPENTLEAIAAGADLALDGIEFDVIQSADGTWWVMHDATLDRTTTGSGWIAELQDESIEDARIDGGLGFVPARHRGLTVPRLSTVLDALAGYDGKIYVDIQHAPTGDADTVAKMLRGRRAAILCRDVTDTRAIKAHDQTIETYLRPEGARADDSVDGWLMEAFFVADVEALQATSRPVVTYVDEWMTGQSEAGLIRRAWATGVTAFLTKQPARAIALLNELEMSSE